tara:strand:+ start:659 stop:1012 length:354 start_codon:yes stop_codon:yes gene_type:complete
MDMREYASKVSDTAVHPNKLPAGKHKNLVGLLYCATKLCGEAGEVSEVIGKALRDDGGTFPPARMANVVKEMGDVFWYMFRIMELLEIPYEQVLEANIHKLADRQERGKLLGDGDNR